MVSGARLNDDVLLHLFSSLKFVPSRKQRACTSFAVFMDRISENKTYDFLRNRF